MFKHYLQAASANLLRHKSYAFITILGLVLGMSSCLLILLYVKEELGFDRWIAEPATLYRYETLSVDKTGKERLMRKSALRAGRDLQAYFPEVAATTRMIDQSAVISTGGREYFETVWFVDASAMDVFRFPLLQGEKSTVLADKSSIVISAQAAAKYFPNSSPLGQVLTLDGKRDFTVSGVFADIPQKSHISPEFLVLYDQNDAQYNFGYSESWGSVEGYTYVRLRPDANAGVINSRLSEFRQHYSPDFVVPAGRKFSDVLRPSLINVLDIHLDAGGLGNIKPPGNKQILMTLSLIALLVLAIASFNFVNLSTVRCLARAREVSVRKAIGAAKIQLIWQFLCESVLVCLLALAVSLSLVELLLPWYNSLLGKQIALHYFSGTTALLVAGAVVLGIFSGIYPALRLSASQPTETLRAGSSGGGQRGGWIQQALVVIQFAISSTLVITALVVLMQQVFISNTAPGYSAERKVIIRNLGENFARDKRELIAAQLAALPGVLGTTFSAATPMDTNGEGFFRPVTTPGQREEAFPLYPKAVGANFFDVYDIALVSGRAFSAELNSDKFFWPPSGDTRTNYASAILNLSAVKAAGFASAEAAVGKTLKMGNTQLEVIGVVPDVHFQSLHNAVTPNMYIYSSEDFATLTVAYAANVDEQKLLADISRVWGTLIPGIPLAYEFLADNISAQYAPDRLQFLLIAIFTALAVVIACMGLYALAAFSTRQRIREISIRKIHGALRTDILGTFMLQFSKPIVLANVLAWPFALYAITRYLEGFEYRVEPGISVFAFASLATLLIAWAAVIFHVMKVANMKPATALRQG